MIFGVDNRRFLAPPRYGVVFVRVWVCALVSESETRSDLWWFTARCNAPSKLSFSIFAKFIPLPFIVLLQNMQGKRRSRKPV